MEVGTHARTPLKGFSRAAKYLLAHGESPEELGVVLLGAFLRRTLLLEPDELVAEIRLDVAPLDFAFLCRRRLFALVLAFTIFYEARSNYF